jgi:hypothetical protein
MMMDVVWLVSGTSFKGPTDDLEARFEEKNGIPIDVSKQVHKYHMAGLQGSDRGQETD